MRNDQMDCISACKTFFKIPKAIPIDYLGPNEYYKAVGTLIVTFVRASAGRLKKPWWRRWIFLDARQ
jgi:hypothetical protein